MGEAPHGLLPRPLACADKRRDPEEGRVGAERGVFYKGTARALNGTCMSASLLVHGGAVLETLPYTCDYALSLDVY